MIKDKTIIKYSKILIRANESNRNQILNCTKVILGFILVGTVPGSAVVSTLLGKFYPIVLC